MAERARQDLTGIAGVVQVSFGVAVTENACYRYTFVIDLSDEQALHRYRDHPIHVAFADAYFRNASSEKLRNGYNLLPLSIRLQVYSSIVLPQDQHGSI